MAKRKAHADAERAGNGTTEKKAPSNLTECLDGEMLARVLHFTKGKDGMPTSAYERFRALAELSDELYLHPILDELSFLLCEGLGITETLTPTSCDRIWRKSAELLLEEADTAEKCLTLPSRRPRSWQKDEAPFSGDLSRQILPSSPELSSLAKARVCSRSAWEKEIADALEALRKQEREHFLFTVPKDYTFVRPDPYHVDLALAERDRKGDLLDLLLSQCLRQLFLLSATHGITPVLYVQGRADAILDGLSFLGRSIALPRLFIAAKSTEELIGAIERVAKERIPNVGFAIRPADHQTDADLKQAIHSAARHYPFGRLCFICTEEDVSFAERRLRDALGAKAE